MLSLTFFRLDFWFEVKALGLLSNTYKWAYRFQMTFLHRNCPLELHKNMEGEYLKTKNIYLRKMHKHFGKLSMILPLLLTQLTFNQNSWTTLLP